MTLRNLSAWAAIASVLLMTGCASTAPKPEFNKELASQYRIDADDHPVVKVDAASGVEILPIDEQRISEVIAAKLDARRMENQANNDPRECVVQVTLTRYQRGNAFARAMLAGLGQIHIDAAVKVYSGSGNEKIADFMVAKTFAWGGIYGASTSMEDIERTFGDGVAAALTEQPDVKKAAANKSH